MKRLRWLCIILGGLLVLDTLIIAPMSNFNLGIILPAILGLPLLLAGLLWETLTRRFSRSKRRIICRLFFGAYGLFLVAFSVTLGFMLHAGLSTPEQDTDAVIVLGAGIRGTRVTRTLATRLNTAMDYWEQDPDRFIIVSGGQGPDEDITEAQAMSDYLIQHGVPADRILLETEATSTQENFRYSRQILTSVCGEDAKAAFVTNTFHVFRAEKTALKDGFECSGIGCPTTWYLIPNCYLREACAIWIYWLLGRI